MEETGARQIPPLEEKPCVVCGKIFMPVRRNQVVCSDACRHQHARKQQAVYNKRRRPRDFAPRACPICGETFTPASRREACCSDSCKGEYMLFLTKMSNLERYHCGYTPKKKKQADLELLCVRLSLEVELLKKALLDAGLPLPDLSQIEIDKEQKDA